MLPQIEKLVNLSLTITLLPLRKMYSSTSHFYKPFHHIIYIYILIFVMDKDSHVRHFSMDKILRANSIRHLWRELHPQIDLIEMVIWLSYLLKSTMLSWVSRAIQQHYVWSSVRFLCPCRSVSHESLCPS